MEELKKKFPFLKKFEYERIKYRNENEYEVFKLIPLRYTGDTIKNNWLSKGRIRYYGALAVIGKNKNSGLWNIQEILISKEPPDWTKTSTKIYRKTSKNPKNLFIKITKRELEKEGKEGYNEDDFKKFLDMTIKEGKKKLNKSELEELKKLKKEMDFYIYYYKKGGQHEADGYYLSKETKRQKTYEMLPELLEYTYEKGILKKRKQK